MTTRSGATIVATTWARRDLRARARSLIALALIAGITAGVVLALVSGARRTHTAFDRLRARTNASDAVVFASQAGVFHPDWSKLAARREVAAVAPWFLTFGALNGDYAVFTGPVTANGWMHTLDQPIVKRGRMFDPTADEMVVDELTAKEEHVHVGDTLMFRAYAPNQDDTAGAPPAGAEIKLRVVGVIRNVQQFIFTPFGILSPGVIARHGNQMEWIENAYVQLRPGRDMRALQRDADATIASGTPVFDLHQAQRRIDTTTDVEWSALLLIALAVAAAGLVLVAQVVIRSAASIGDDAASLRAIGMRRRDLVRAGVLPHVVAAAGAAVVALLTAIVASAWFPVGLAGRVDPDRGVHVDWAVLLPGLLALLIALIGGAALVARRAARPARAGAGRSHSRLMPWVRANTPVSVGIGAGLVFDRASRRRDVSAVPAIVAAIVGITGVLATVMIDRGLNDALAHPERAGVTWDTTVSPVSAQYTPRGLTPAFVASVRGVDGVQDTAVIDRLVVPVNGVGAPGFTLRPPPGTATDIKLALLSGRAPRDGEAAIGPKTAHDLGVHPGDTVTVGDGAHARTLRVIGEALFPTDVHATFDEGIWIAPATWDGIVPASDPAMIAQGKGASRVVAVRAAPGTDEADFIGRLNQALGPRADNVEPVEVPEELTNLRNVRSLPVVLAVFLALLALAALSYVLFTTTRARRRDFAIFRAVGFTRRQARSVIGTESIVVGGLGIVVGIPLGVALGRSAWTLITERVPIQDVAPYAATAALVLVPVALVLSVAVALGPARSAARVRPAEVLRTE